MKIDAEPLVLLYLAFAVKHYLCDFALQTIWMARGKGAAVDFAAPLAAHAGIHAAGTGLIVLAADPRYWWLALVDLFVHAAIDRTKGIATRGFLPVEGRFWRALGLDQMAHQLTHFAFVLTLCGVFR